MQRRGASATLFFDPEAETHITHGAHLPHWRQNGVIYFVTFRLADSLPQRKLQALKDEKAIWHKLNPEPRTRKQKIEYCQRFVDRVQYWLDQGYGSMILQNNTARELVDQAITHFVSTRYELDKYTIAGNHVHLLVTPLSRHRLTDILHTWKSFTAKQILKLPLASKLKTAPLVWQKESWDHIVRSEAALEKFRKYIQAHKK